MNGVNVQRLLDTTMELPPIPPDTDRASIDAALSELAAHKTEWAQLPLSRKRALLHGLHQRVGEAAGRWVTVASRAKGLPLESPLRNEEWLSGPWGVLSYCAALERTLEHVEAGTLGELVDGKAHQRSGGQTVVRVYPDTGYDQILSSGFTVEVWMEPGVTPESLTSSMATVYQEEAPEGAVALVLGAGNIASIPPLDVISKLYAEGSVCLLKMNPVNSYLGPLFEEVFSEFVDAGYMRFAYGGVDVGVYLTRHEAVEEIHVTGSATTHDAIVYGTGPEGAARKERDEPEINVPVTSELGGVSPIVVLPGDWSEPDLDYQAEHVVTMRTHNAGFNCIAGQILVLPAEWPQREAFLDAIREVLREIPDRPAYYPGAEDRMEAIDAEYPNTQHIGIHRIVEVTLDDGAYAFETEFFGDALAVVSLPGGSPEDDPGDWLRRAVDFCNHRLTGTLGANLLAHPRTLRQLGDRLDDELARLRYGTIAVNAWTGVGFLLPQAVWGAYPGHTRDDVQSGIGKVHNALLFSRPQKSVVTGPFAPFPRSLLLGETHTAPKPPWFVTNETAAETAQRWTELVAAPSPLKLPGLLSSALRG
ncbi:MAG: aldehyde dehydrogenase family protein [Rubricoccaceae bacterium]